MRTRKEFRPPNRNTDPIGATATTTPGESMPGSKGLNVCACAYPAENSNNEIRCYLHALRRRWKVILVVGVVLAVVAAIPVKFQSLPSYTASTLLRIDSANQPLAFETRVSGSESMLETKRLTYKELLKSRTVLATALENPSIASLPKKDIEAESVEWLANKIKTKIVERSSEIVQVDLQDNNPEHACLLVDAVADAFVDWCADEERKQRRKQIAELQLAYREKQTELARQQTDYAGLIEAVGGVDAETLTRRGGMAIELLAESQKEKTRLKFEMQRLESEQQAQRNMRLDPSNQIVANADLAGLGRSDPLANKLLLELEEMERYASKIKALVAPEAVERFEQHGQIADLAEARKHYLSRLAELQRSKEAALEADIERLRSQIAVIENQSSELERKIEEQNAGTEKKRTSLVEVKILKSDIQRTEEVLSQLTQKIKEVEVNVGSISPVSVAQRAETPKKPTNKSIHIALVAFAALLGFLLPGACIILWDVYRQIINGPSDVPSRFNLSLLGTLPAKAKRRFDLRHPFRAVQPSRQCVVDAAESMQMMILGDRYSRNRVLMVCSAENDEGASALARELAVSLAHGDYRTVLVDVNLRQPQLHREFDVPLACGVCETLCERSEIWDILHETRTENLWLAPAGKWNDKIHAAMVRGNASLMVDTLRSIFQFVVIAGGPVLQGSETRFFSRYADAVLFSVKRDVTRANRAAEAVEILRSLDINLLGAAVTM